MRTRCVLGCWLKRWILTVVGVLFSVAVATTNQFTIFIAGLSDLLACAFSMASGEYASVSTQKDTEEAVVRTEERLLKTNYADEVEAVVNHYTNLGVSRDTAEKIANNLMAKKPLETVVSVKYDLKLNHYMNHGQQPSHRCSPRQLGESFHWQP